MPILWVYTQEEERQLLRVWKDVENVQKETKKNPTSICRVKKKDIESINQKQHGDQNERNVSVKRKCKELFNASLLSFNLEMQMATSNKVTLIPRNFVGQWGMWNLQKDLSTDLIIR